MFNSKISDLKYHASGQWISILHTLAPQLNQACERPGRHVPCPTHGGKDGFRLFNDVEQTGGGICNTCGAFANGFDLLQWMNGWTFPEAKEAVEHFIGMGEGYTPLKRTTPKPLPEKNWESQRQWLQKLWDEAEPNHPRLKQYLEYRGLSVDPPPSLRLHEGLKYLDDQGKNLGTFPCMIAQFIRGHDLVGMHVTFLDRNNPGKADVEHEKKIWKCANTVTGGSIHLFDSQPNKPLALVEGIESGLSVMELSNYPVWVCGNAGLMERVEIPESVHSIYIGGDKDRSGQGKKSTTNLATRLCNEGVRVKTSFPPIEIPDGASSVDWNDYVAMGREVVHG